MGMSKPIKKNIVCWGFFAEESSGFFFEKRLEDIDEHHRLFYLLQALALQI